MQNQDFINVRVVRTASYSVKGLLSEIACSFLVLVMFIGATLL